MGNDALVLWLSPALARAYFVAVTVGMVGLLQWVAHYWGQERLRWLPAPLVWPVGGVLMGGALATFYVNQYPLIFVPGPAGLELILLFAGATALATWLSRALAALARRLG